jgi:hypothetical protein
MLILFMRALLLMSMVFLLQKELPVCKFLVLRGFLFLLLWFKKIPWYMVHKQDLLNADDSFCNQLFNKETP